MTVPSSGTSGHPITIGAYGTGANPIINGSDLVATWTLDSGNIWQATLTTEPRAVYLNGTKGTEQTAKASVDAANEWFWQADVLYVYSTTDPDTAFTNPGIEAVLRHGIDINGKDYVTVNNIMTDKTNKGINVDWKDEGDLIEGFENTADWTISGTGAAIAADTTNYVEGAGSINLSGTSGVISMTKTINEDLSDADVFTIAAYVSEFNIGRNIRIDFSSTTDFSKYYRANSSGLGYGADVGWNRFVFSKSDFTATGGEDWSNTMIRVRIGDWTTPSATTPANMTFDDLKKAQKANPVALLTFDDGRASVLSIVEPIMTANNQVGTAFVHLNSIEGEWDGYMHLDDLTTLQTAGWDISNHTKTHPYAEDDNLTTMSPEELDDEVNGMRTWLINNGFSQGADFFAYPGGIYNTAVINKVAEHHKIARTTKSFAYQAHPDGTNDDFFILGDDGSPTTANAQTHIDNTIDRGGIITFLWHNVGTDYTTEDFQTVSNYLKTKVDLGLIQVMTMSEYWDYITFTDITIHNNIIKNPEVGIYVGGNSNNASVYNNTVYSGVIGIQDKSLNAYVKNNVVSNQTYRAGEYWWGTLTEAYNNWYGTSNGFTPAATDLNADPLFTNAATGDFSLQATSPNIDAGVDVNLSTDFVGKQRYDYPNIANTGSVGSYSYNYWDIGAYEYVTPPNPVLQSNSHPSESAWYPDATPDMSLSSNNSATTHYHYLVDQTAAPSAATVQAGTSDSDGTFTIPEGTITSDGTWYVHLIASNLDGDFSANYDTYTIKYDGTNPVISTSSPANNTTTCDYHPGFTWSGSDATSGIAKYQLYLNGSLDTDNISGTSTDSTNALNWNGTNTWYVRAIDNAGNYTDSSTYNLSMRYCGSYFIPYTPPTPPASSPSEEQKTIPTPTPTSPNSTIPTTPTSESATNNILIKYPDSPKVYLIENGLKKWIVDENTFISKGYLWSEIKTIDNSQTFPDGENIVETKTTIKTFNFTHFLTLGSVGTEVRELQTLLKNLGYFTYPAITGYYGSVTKEAVKKFQIKYGIEPVGYVGPKTRLKLNEVMAE